jgi:hypothetical protein
MILSTFMTSQRMRATRVFAFVHEDVAAVIGAVGERHMRMVEVAILVGAAAVLQEFHGLRQQALGQDLAALIGEAPAGGRAAVEDGYAHEFAHGGHAENAQLAALAAAGEHVVLVELTRLDRRLQSILRPRRPDQPAAEGADRAAARDAGHAGKGGHARRAGQHRTPCERGL